MPPDLALPDDFAACPHDRGAGIAVCLRCRAEANRRAAQARQRIVGRVAIACVVMLGIAAAAGGGFAGRVTSGAARGGEPVTSGATPARPESFHVTAAAAAETGRAPAIGRAPGPLVGEGQTPLSQGMFALRTGDSVSVHFDTPLLRTRRRDKFEQVVRATLPALYGATADAALRAVADGELTARGDLLRELPARGLALPARDGWAITLWPRTRAGRDGPLVVSYGVSVAPAR